MKLTPTVKKDIDGMSAHQVYTMFRFHPTDMTTGESGKYMQNTIHEKIRKEKDKTELSDEQKPKVFGIT